VERFVFAIVRGDMEVNETMLANAIKAKELRPAREDEIRRAGAEPGFASPVGLARGEGQALKPMIIVDDLIPRSPNLVAGANLAGYHLRNVNYGRDYTADLVTDIAAAEEGSLCPECGYPMRALRGVEVANIFKLGARYSEAMGCTFLDAAGVSRPVIMGSYGIGVTRLLACIAEHYHDEHGLRWPVAIAPYQVHLVALVGKRKLPLQEREGQEKSETALADRLYAELWKAGIETLYDDRDESPGVKFNDADLIGLPVRLTVSERALKAGGVELKRRDRAEKEIVPLDEVLFRVKTELAALASQFETHEPTPFTS
jgi:prolyl-tRNA synthetase